MNNTSLIVITWNSLTYVKQTLPKLLSLKDIHELIYVDNGSTDGTLEYLQTQKNIKLIENKQNLGISIAKNQGTNIATGQHLLLLDDDMLIENENLLTNLVNYYEQLNNPAFLMPLFLDKEELEQGNTRSYGTYYYPFGIHVKKQKQNIQKIMEYEKQIPIAINQGGAMFIKKSIWDTLGGFDESQKFNLDDDDISTRAMIYGYNNYLYNKEHIVHLGLQKRADKNRYAWNDQTYYSGKSKVIWKNFSVLTIIWMWFLFSGRTVAESIYHTIYYKHLPIFISFIKSFFTFLKDLKGTIKNRKTVQLNRKIKDSEILKLKPPRYES
jgi:GT2 family glycosyltransferase